MTHLYIHLSWAWRGGRGARGKREGKGGERDDAWGVVEGRREEEEEEGWEKKPYSMRLK